MSAAVLSPVTVPDVSVPGRDVRVTVHDDGTVQLTSSTGTKHVGVRVRLADLITAALALPEGNPR